MYELGRHEHPVYSGHPFGVFIEHLLLLPATLPTILTKWLHLSSFHPSITTAKKEMINKRKYENSMMFYSPFHTYFLALAQPQPNS